MCPPQVALGVGQLPSCYHALGCPSLVHHDHLDAIEMVGCQSVLLAQVAKSATEHMAADANVGTDTRWESHSPAQEQLPIHLAKGGTGFDNESAHV